MHRLLTLVCVLACWDWSQASLLPPGRRLIEPSCSDAPCKNGGTCTTWKSSYRCSCPPSYVGETCEYQRCDASLNKCFNGGTCITNSTMPQENYCKCAENWSGDRCEYWILLTDFDDYINMTKTGDLRYVERCEYDGVVVSKRYAVIGKGESFRLTNDYVGFDGKEFCLYFQYKVDSPDAVLEVSSKRRHLASDFHKLLWPYRNSQHHLTNWVHFHGTFMGHYQGVFEINGSIPKTSEGSLYIDQIKVVKGPCQTKTSNKDAADEIKKLIN